jgi:hypothetical protein
MRNGTIFGIAAALILTAVPAGAQVVVASSASTPRATTEATTEKDSTASKVKAPSTQPTIVLQHFRAQDQRGLNIFEAPKDDGVPYEGFRLSIGAAFAQQFQSLDHSNTAAPKMADNVDVNNLMDIGPGFNNATANLYLNAQLAPGIRVALTSYLSSRHHNETWVKDGYLLVDASPINVAALNTIMEYVTLRVGHFEVNYGDAHFRRTDNGNALYNPFVGNYILDAFTTEIGGEVYFRAKDVMVMGGVTGGEIRGDVKNPDTRNPAFLGKAGFDHRFSPDVRLRLMGSVYTTKGSPSSTLYTGDRAGSRYYLVLENTQASEDAQRSSGLLNPGFRNQVTAYQLNPFARIGGLELFGVIEHASGKATSETEKRDWNQYAADVVYRFGSEERLFVGGRYNTANGRLAGMTTDDGAERYEIGGGWFLTQSVLLKAEYVNQKYNDFPTLDIRNGGKFNGLMFEGVVAF